MNQHSRLRLVGSRLKLLRSQPTSMPLRTPYPGGLWRVASHKLGYSPPMRPD